MFIYQLGEWGPIAEMTDMRYKVEDDNYWLWEKTEGHCEVCVDYGDWFSALTEPEEIIDMTVSDVSEEEVATAWTPPEVTEIAGLADIIAYDISSHTPEEKCQIAQEFYWALLQILDRDNDGMLSVSEFDDHAETLTGFVAFGDSDSLLGWFEDNAMAVSEIQGRAVTSREILNEVG